MIEQVGQAFRQMWRDAWDFLSAESGPGIETARSHSWPWPPSATVLLLVAVVVFVAAIYYRERGHAGRLRKAVLTVLRVGLLGLVLFMWYGWMLHRYRTDLPDVVVMLDDSTSMTTVDRGDDETAQKDLARRLQPVGLDGGSRWNQAKLVLFENDGRLLDELQRKYRLKLYCVGGSARLQEVGPESDVEEASPPPPLADRVRALAARETASRLGKGVRDVLTAQRGRPTAAIIVLTDGVTTEGKTIGEVAEVARRKAVPLFLVGLGSDRPPRDVRLSDVLVEEVVFVGDQVNFDFKVTASGFAGQRAAVRLRAKDRPGEPLAAETVTLGADGEPQSVRLSYRPPEKGDFQYVVEVEPLAGEVTSENNRESRLVRVRDETLRVLLVQEYPSYEFRFLKNALSRGLKVEGREKSVLLHTVLQEADLEYAQQDETALRVFPVSREELFAYDVLIFGDVSPAFLSRSVLENIAAFVAERGGGMVVIAGPRHTPLAYRDSPLAKLLPVNLDTAVVPPPGSVAERPYPVQPTRLGLSSPQMQLETTAAGNLRVWKELPPLYWLLEAADLRPGTRVLAVDPQRTRVGGENLPVISMQFVGAGKVILQATDETYRWARHPDGDAYYVRYWVQTVRYLSHAKLLAGSRTAELRTDRQQYRCGEPVRLRLRFFDDRQAPAADDGVTVVLEHEGSRRRQLTLRRDAAERGIFEGSAVNLPDGAYRAWLAAPTLEGQPPAQQFSVLAPPGEEARLQMDAADLRQAAKTSEGKFYTIETAGRLADDLPRGRQVRLASLPPTPIWNSPLLAALFVGLIAAEWIIRKRGGLL
jgi:hypothetical protein